MSTIKVNAIQHTSANGSNMTLFANGNVAMTTANTILTVGNTVISNSGISVAGNAINPLSIGMRNRIINGAMMIDQRSSGNSVSTSTSTTIYTLDRWNAIYNQTSKYTVQQNAGSVTPPFGFTNYLGITSSSSYSSLSTDYFSIRQFVEGFNFYDFMWGTANAQPATLSFWVRSSLTGSHSGAIVNGAFGVGTGETRSYAFTFTVNSANTWEYKTITIVGDTTVSSTNWPTTNGAALQLRFDLGSGTTYRTATTGSWIAGNFVGVTGAVSVVGTSGATFYVTGVQFEEGTVATPFEWRHYGQELALCQRYYYRVSSGGVAYAGFAIGRAYSTTAGSAILHLPVSMRSAPILGTSSLSSGNFDYGVTNLSLGCDTSNRIVTLTTTTLSVSQSQSSWQLGAGNVTSNVYLEFSSEL